jgi:hypothetical protein
MCILPWIAAKNNFAVIIHKLRNLLIGFVT